MWGAGNALPPTANPIQQTPPKPPVEKPGMRLTRRVAEADKLDLARRELANGTGICKTAKLTGLGTGTVHKLKWQIEAG